MKNREIPRELIQDYYSGLLTNLANCRFCGGSKIYLNKVETVEIAYCINCLGSAPIDVWNGKFDKASSNPHKWMENETN